MHSETMLERCSICRWKSLWSQHGWVSYCNLPVASMSQLGQRVVWLPTVHTYENPFTSFPDSIPSRILLRKYRTPLSHFLRFWANLRILHFPWPNTAEVVSQPPHAWIARMWGRTVCSECFVASLISISFSGICCASCVLTVSGYQPYPTAFQWKNYRTRMSVSSAITVVCLPSEAKAIAAETIWVSASFSLWITAWPSNRR